MSCCEHCFRLRLAAYVKTCFIEKGPEGYTVWNKKRDRRFGTYKTKEQAEKRLRQMHYFKHVKK